MKDFAAIDFETANFERTSVCSVGVVVVRDGKKVDQFYSLIHPEPDYYNYVCSSVNGLCREDTEEAPIFPDVWKQIEPKIEGLPLVAHNKAFDETCLKAVFRMYQMDYPDYPFYCTLIKSRQVWPDHRRALRLRPKEPSPCPCRCRGMRCHSIKDSVNANKIHFQFRSL